MTSGANNSLLSVYLAGAWRLGPFGVHSLSKLKLITLSKAPPLTSTDVVGGASQVELQQSCIEPRASDQTRP